MSITSIHEYVKLITAGVSANRSDYFSIVSKILPNNSIIWVFTASISYSKKASKDSTETTENTKRQQEILRESRIRFG